MPENNCTVAPKTPYVYSDPIDMPVHDLYRAHWSVTGRAVPGAGTADEAVYLPGRNVMFLSKAMVWCHLNGFPAVAMATLGSNPFPDASTAFCCAVFAASAIGGPARRYCHCLTHRGASTA